MRPQRLQVEACRRAGGRPSQAAHVSCLAGAATPAPPPAAAGTKDAHGMRGGSRPWGASCTRRARASGSCGATWDMHGIKTSAGGVGWGARQSASIARA